MSRRNLGSKKTCTARTVAEHPSISRLFSPLRSPLHGQFRVQEMNGTPLPATNRHLTTSRHFLDVESSSAGK